MPWPFEQCVMHSLDAVTVILSEVGEPLHVNEITRRILERGLWQTKGQILLRGVRWPRAARVR